MDKIMDATTERSPSFTPSGERTVKMRPRQQVSENIKKVAVTMKGEQAQFIELDQNRPLAAIIRDVCDGWMLTNADDHALQVTEPNRPQTYITERNRHEIQNGNVLRLTSSPSKTAKEILEQLNYGTQEKKLEALKDLANFSVDVTFAVEFINTQGLRLILQMVEGGGISGESLAFTLKAFVELMDHGIVSWDILEPKFIKNVSGCISKSGCDPTTLQSALEILESTVLHSSSKAGFVEQEVTPVNLIVHLQSSNPDIQKSAIALINALFLKAESQKRRAIAESLQSKSIRNVILSHVIRGPNTVGTEMAHQLYMLQSLMFNLLEERMNAKVDKQDQVSMALIVELKKLAFDTENENNTTSYRKQSNFGTYYKKLGFQHHSNPVEDFTEVPPGALALDNMAYFARSHIDSYTKVVLENSCRADEHDCPFARASIELTKMLCDILNIGDTPSEEGQVYHPMFFTHDRPFEEFYVICIQLLNKTWKEMRATAEDFAKVLGVVKEQITRALDQNPATFDAFRSHLGKLTYSEITHLWQEERKMKEERESFAKPIQELREQIKPEMMELIKQQRLNALMEGMQFTKYSNKGQRLKDKFWYCRLSPNQKLFYYGDCNESGPTPALETLPHKLAVVDIKALVTGRECPHVKEKALGKKSTPLHAFSIMSDTADQALNFVASNEQEYNTWTDGVNALLGNPMVSEMTTQELDMLLSMEIKIRLLDTEGVTIPESPPPIPPPPPNFDFKYKI
ncbi:engulfment and cell motility protein 1 [Lingula anatina]|uniref:Engulfment and cell motility protein 1 n=1 Tax=Lingula anatina TaxID=7574 RepID=A0A1S3JYB2_LINAN|nr:engulfment and cell motility protein 1 [Lingula anatina]|eukprot:XP_013415031.1 engulfment and cell motility protein 1 [Lingula anatina]